MDAAVASETLDSRQLLKVLRAFRKGDFAVRLPTDLIGADGAIAEAFNDVVELNQEMTKELSRLSTAVGKDGRTSQRGNWMTPREGGPPASTPSIA